MIILITASLGWKRAIHYFASQALEAERQEAERQYFTYLLVCWVARKLQPWAAILPRTAFGRFAAGVADFLACIMV